MSKDFAPFLLTPFKAPPSLADSLRRSTSGNCEHPTPMKEPKNPKIDGAPTTVISVPGQGGKGSGGTNLTLAFSDFDKQFQQYENDRMRWLENQLSPRREGAGTGGGAPLQMVSGSPSTLTITPTEVQQQGTSTIVWTFTVSASASGAYYA